MKYNKKEYLALTLVMVILIAPIILFSFIFVFEDFFNSLPSYIKTIYGIICLFVLAPLDFVLVFKSKGYKNLIEHAVAEYNKKENTNRQHKF